MHRFGALDGRLRAGFTQSEPEFPLRNALKGARLVTKLQVSANIGIKGLSSGRSVFMSEIKLIDTYLAPLEDKTGGFDVHNGTSVNGIPFDAAFRVVDPPTVTPVITDLLCFRVPTQQVVCKLYQIDDGRAPSLANAPLYFGVGYRAGISKIGCINLFCHPSPAVAKMGDADYIGLKGNWSSLFRYIQYFSVQLAEAVSDMVLVMPMFTEPAWQRPDSFRARWKELLNGLLVEVQKLVHPSPPIGPPILPNPLALSDLILSDFSSGRALLTKLRPAPGLEASLREIWDFDGQQAVAPAHPKGGQLLLYNQQVSPGHVNVFHLPLSRWAKSPDFMTCKSKMKQAERQRCIHANFPRLFLHAAKTSKF